MGEKPAEKACRRTKRRKQPECDRTPGWRKIWARPQEQGTKKRTKISRARYLTALRGHYRRKRKKAKSKRHQNKDKMDEKKTSQDRCARTGGEGLKGGSLEKWQKYIYQCPPREGPITHLLVWESAAVNRTTGGRETPRAV